MKAHVRHIAERLEETETAEKSAVIALYDTPEAAEKAIRELPRLGCASNLTEFGKRWMIQEAENQIPTLVQSSQPVLDFCRNQRFICRMAKKLGCQICARK